jgi:hypothetical protein
MSDSDVPMRTRPRSRFLGLFAKQRRRHRNHPHEEDDVPMRDAHAPELEEEEPLPAPRAAGAGGAEGPSSPAYYSSQASSVHTPSRLLHPEFPRLVSSYCQLFFHGCLVFFALYLFYVLYSSVQADVETRVDEYSSEVLNQIAECHREWRENRCGSDDRPPALTVSCVTWEQCMRRDPRLVARARISAETVAHILNSFVEPLSVKTIGAGLALILVLVLASNFMYRSWAVPAAPAPVSAAIPAQQIHVESPMKYATLQPPQLQLSPDDVSRLLAVYGARADQHRRSRSPHR